MATNKRSSMKPSQSRSARAPAGYDPGNYPAFAVTVDIVILTVVAGELSVLLINRRDDPYAGHWALPGGFKHPDETLDQAASRELLEEAGLAAPTHLEQLRAYGDPGRDPRMNVVTVAYLAVIRTVGELTAGTDAREAALWPVAAALNPAFQLAFDHRVILSDSIDKVRADLEHKSLATAFVGPAFTLSELRNVYETVWNIPLDPANFRRSLVSADETYLEPTGRRSEPGPEGGRPPELYRATRQWESGSPVKRRRKR